MGKRRLYQAYGMRIRSALPLPCEAEASADPPDIDMQHGAPGRVRGAQAHGTPRRSWFHRIREADGAEYLRWSGLYECLVSADGRRIRGRSLNGSATESFQTFFASQALSFALVKLGVEPLHATTVIVDGGAVAFLGECGQGKSTLGASFLQAGFPLLTDDLLVLKPGAGARDLAYPGLPRIKLFPAIARTLLGAAHGRPLNPLTNKVVIRLSSDRRSCRRPVPIRACYCLASRATTQRIRIRRLAPRAACLALIAHTFNPVSLEPERLARQFAWAARLAARVPVKSVAYPRNLRRLPAVRQTILQDLADG
ncbi:MAG: hypothetical protein HY596_00750 [Candidatus Omnitrophica bacterium]|nr:hypothetical protein [Candidatus Omnitrophota bacterium]